MHYKVDKLQNINFHKEFQNEGNSHFPIEGYDLSELTLWRLLMLIHVAIASSLPF